MLAIPAMKADPSADVNHLGIYLRNQNSYPEQQIQRDVQKFEQFRRDALTVTEASDNGQQSLLRYVALLKSIIPRFVPIQAELKISLAWSDAFTTSKKVTSSALSLDLASCLWNLAAFESLLGGRVDRSTDEGIREANKHFQQAAGYFQFISDNVLPNLGSISSPCLSHDSLMLCKQLMLAQAQLCFYEKAVKDKKKDCMKSVVVAKLAAQAAIFYSSSATTSRSGTLSSILDISWFAVSDFQFKCFRGAAEYWQALASKESALQRGSGYGEEVVRYNRAEVFVRQALETSKKYNLPSGLVGGAEALLQAITANRYSAQHDLQTVYMEALPAESSLTDVQPVAMVKPANLPEFSTLLSEQDQVFRYVLPRAIIESNKNFYDEVNTYHQRASLDAENATNLGRTMLSSMGLPGSLDAVKADQPLPDTLWSKVQKVQSMGGYDRLTALLTDLKAAKLRAWTKMSEIEDSLANEERTSTDFKGRYPSFSGLMADASAVQDIRANNNKLRDAYLSAQANDDKIEADLNAAQDQLKTLSKNRGELEQLFVAVHQAAPSGGVDLLNMDENELFGKPKPSAEAARLEESLHAMAELFETRGRLLEQMKSITQVDLLEYVLKTLENGGDVYAQHVKYANDSKALKAQIEEGIGRQEALLKDIAQLNDAFLKSRENDPAALARNKVIQGLEQSAALYFGLHSQISSGLTFYSNLRAKLTTLQQNCDDMAYTQQWQRQEFEQGQVGNDQKQSHAQQEEQDHQLAMKLAQELSVAPPTNAAPSLGVYPGQTAAISYTASGYPPAQPSQPSIVVPVVPATYSGAPVSLFSSPPIVPLVNPSAAPSTVIYTPANSQRSQSPATFQTISSSTTPVPAPTYPLNTYPGTNPAYNPASSPYNPNVPYQYNNTSYPVLSTPAVSTPPAPLPAPTATYSVPPAVPSTTASSFEQKVSRIAEMGFSVESVVAALQANDNNEEAALNCLLSASSSESAANNAPAHHHKKGWFGGKKSK